jgi:hypothetical protein
MPTSTGMVAIAIPRIMKGIENNIIATRVASFSRAGLEGRSSVIPILPSGAEPSLGTTAGVARNVSVATSHDCAATPAAGEMGQTAR